MQISWHCYYTPKYEALAKEGLENWTKFGLNVTLHPYDDCGNWDLNCMKRSVLLNQIPPNGFAIGLIDSDIRFIQDPILLKKWEQGDILVHRTDRVEWAFCYSVGLCAFAPTKTGRLILSRWAQECEQDKIKPRPNCAEQLYFYATLEKTACSKNLLPKSYCYVPKRDEMTPTPKETVVFHQPASRVLKASVNVLQNTPCIASQAPQASPIPQVSFNVPTVKEMPCIAPKMTSEERDINDDIPKPIRGRPKKEVSNDPKSGQ